ncbi:hypothetical protein [Sandaracinus amylolyticus]|uniref:hypothetical protein n=1 Tax=Sandaracinus amylolyticus TaxID=927083 RepID=UPI001F3B352D|nr:hypothetical protein [Sandaracinus amylolyticus]UJR83322.1 Hypothetical protein I5071_53900 [Sandaracinus amylolyticus]
MDEALAKKLQLKPGRSFRALHAPSAIELESTAKGAADVVLCFVGSQAELAKRWEAAVRALAPDGVLWMAYPKKSAGTKTDIDRDSGWGPFAEAGWAPVSQVSIDDTWSALRWKHDPALREERAARGTMRRDPTVKKKTAAKRR